MKLYSHGFDSDLREHLVEVMTAAETPEERILCASHDLGKATAAWQAYILDKNLQSPHHHAAAGGIFAALLILELKKTNATEWALITLHAGAAHHTFVQQLSTNFLGDLSLVAADQQVREFIFDNSYGIASLLPEVSTFALKTAWERFVRIAPPVSRERVEFNRILKMSLSPELRLKSYLSCRSLLGRLCLQDHRSAAKQSGKKVKIHPWREAFPEAEFSLRPSRKFSGSATAISRLRSQLKDIFLHEITGKQATFYFIDAPTGLGKTEAMLSGAEWLQQHRSYHRIVYAVPQVSVADQVFEDYFSNCEAQIWNYRRREKISASGGSKSELRTGNGSDAQALEIEQNPFDSSYNVTTFNQVLLAMCHPDRNRCLRGLGLRNAVVILDEFHKLPQVILPFFFRLAREYAEQFRCTFILGSATPLEPFAFWDLEDSVRIPKEDTIPIYQAPEINNRRLYQNIGKLTVTDLGDQIETIQKTSERNLLVVLNLIGEGTWPLRKYFGVDFQPWRQLEELYKKGSNRIMVWLDGLVPPCLRRKLITACCETMKHRPVTLVSTQMIEVGVDLDFDTALIDYQGIAATIQRGGRVGRNGRTEPCCIKVFSLINEESKSSFEQLLGVREKNDARLKASPFDELFKEETKFLNLEMILFREWNAQQLRDSDLTEKLSAFQQKIFAHLTLDKIFTNFFSIDSCSGQNIGASFEKAQFVAELFDSESSEPIILVESQDCYEELCRLNHLIEKQKSTKEERRVFLNLLTDRMITPSPKIILELGLSFCGWIDYPERIAAHRLDSLIL